MRARTHARRGFLSLLALVMMTAARTSSAAAPAGDGRRGWADPRAFDLAKAAIGAKKDGDLQLCVEKDQASLAVEEHPYVKLHLSACLGAMGKLVEALGHARDALAAAIRADDAALQEAARQRVTEILPRIGHVRLTLPKDSTGIKVTFDNVPVRPALFARRIAVDPGEHVVEASQAVSGEERVYRERITLAEGEEKTLEIVPRPSSLTPGEKECLERSTSHAEKLGCLEQKSTKPSVRVGVEMSAYTDTTHVHVLSPAMSVAVASPTAGWSASGSYLVDVVTAASPDIVSMASPRFRETRHAGAMNGGYTFGAVRATARGNVSREPDYLSMTAGAGASFEPGDKLVTPSLGYGLTRDRIGIRNTPFAQFERNLTTHQIEAGVTFVLSPATLLVTGITVQLERGENAKLYRYVPMFAPGDAGSIQPGEPVASVNAKQVPMRSREVVPSSRDRFAIGARINHRLGSGTFRVEERLYTDTWGVKASTTDVRYLHDLATRLRVGPHVHYHVQSAAGFYRLAYVAEGADGKGPLVLPAFRTGDRELSKMMAITGGASARIALTTEEASVKYAVTLSGDVVYSSYARSLFIEERTAVYGTLGFEAEL